MLNPTRFVFSSFTHSSRSICQFTNSADSGPIECWPWPLMCGVFGWGPVLQSMSHFSPSCSVCLFFLSPSPFFKFLLLVFDKQVNYETTHLEE